MFRENVKVTMYLGNLNVNGNLILNYAAEEVEEEEGGTKVFA
jgi:hypothetical protein